MENKSNKKYYLIAVIVIIVVIVIMAFSLVGSKSTGQKAPQADRLSSSMLANTVNAPNVPVKNSTADSANGLVGTWVSTTEGKGMVGSGKIVYQGKNVKIDMTSDVNLIINKVENNVGTGELTFNHACLTETIITTGKPDSAKPAQCLDSYSQPAEIQIEGNTIKYTGKSFLGASISLSGAYSTDSMSGTYTRTSSSGKINGTFDLVRAKN